MILLRHFEDILFLLCNYCLINCDTNLSHISQALKTVLPFYEAIQINKNENKKTCTDVKDAPLNIYKKILRHTHLH